MPPVKKDSRILISLYSVAGTMILFTLARVLLFFLNRDFFASLSGEQILSAFLNGLRFDFSVVALFMGPAVFLLNLPVKTRWWLKLWAGVLVFERIFFAGFLAADLIYFPKVNRHIAEEVLHLADDWGFVVSYAFTQVWPLVAVLAAVFTGAVVWIGRRADKAYQPRRWDWKKEAACLAVIALATAVGIRGQLGFDKAVGVADAYRYVSSPAGAALTLNGVFTAYQVGRKGRVVSLNEFDSLSAVENAQKALVASDETVPDARYPLMRKRKHAPAAPAHNVMIVLLEGWHPYYIDGLSGSGFGATPVFDQILKDGVNFTNAYAVGLRSMFGFAAVFAGLPPVTGLPAFGYGLELSSISPMPKHFADAGYYTFFAQTSHRDSYRLCALASSLGARESYGWEDMPERLDYKEKAPFGYDYDAFQFAADKIKNRKEPHFLGMVFTGITHEPFTSTLPQFDKYPYDSWQHGFLNTLSFADWSIGEFLKRAKEDGWFDDTIFVFVADHTSGAPAGDNSLKNRFRIPLVIYAPKILKAREIGYVVSQADIVPTLYRLTGLNPAYSAFGRDMFDASAPRAALVSEGVNIGLVTDEGEMRHSGNKILEETPFSPSFNQDGKTEEMLLSLDKAAYTLLKTNRWYGSAAQ